MSFRPVDLGVSNAVLEAFSRGQQLAVEKQRLAQEAQLRQQELEQQHEYQKGELDVRQKSLDMEKALHELAMLHTQQEIGETYSKTGIAPTGTKIERPSSYTPQSTEQPDQVKTQAMPISSSLGLAPGEVRVNIPGIGPIVVPSHEDYLQKQIEETGKLAEAKEAPQRKTSFGVADIQSQRAHDVEMMKVFQSIIENQNNRNNALNIANIRANATTAAARARGKDREATLASGIGQQFNQHPVSKTYDTLSFAKDIANNPDTSDYELLHAFARAQNPDLSGDPQAELKLIESLPSYGAQLGAKIDQISAGKQFFEGGQRQKAIDFINTRHALQEKALSGVRDSFGKRIKEATGEDPEGYLRNAIKERSQGTLKTGHSIGDVVQVGGKNIKITKIYSDGTFDGDEVK